MKSIDTWNKFGLGVQNEAEQRLTDIFQENKMVIASTHFQQHKRWLSTQRSLWVKEGGRTVRGQSPRETWRCYFSSFKDEETMSWGRQVASRGWKDQELDSLPKSVPQLCLTLCDPVDCSIPGFFVHHQLLELAQTHVHWISDAIEPSHPLSSPSPPAFNLSQHQLCYYRDFRRNIALLSHWI